MLHAGLDLSRRRLDVCLIGDEGDVVGRLAAPPDADGLRHLVERVGPQGRVRGVIESMTGARFVRDTLEEDERLIEIVPPVHEDDEPEREVEVATFDQRMREREVSRKTRPMNCPLRAVKRTPHRSRVYTRAGASAIKFGGPALDCHEGGPPRWDAQRVIGERGRGGPCSCCTLDWISAVGAWTSA